MLRKFLMIGLGGSGGKTLRYLKQNLEERFEEIGWDEGMPEGWQFLHIDTPAQQDSPVLPGSPALLDADEYLSLTNPGIKFKAIVESLQDKGEDFAGWLVDHRINIPIEMGAGQYRAVGRIIGLYCTDHIKRRLLGKQRALMSAGAAAQLDRLADRFAGGQVSAEAPPPVAIVVSSLAGGTGAGILSDVCDILRADGDEWLNKSISILYSADVFAELSASAGAGIQPNTAAAIAELLHGYFADGSFVPPGGGAVQQRSGPAFPYLVGHANAKGVSFGNQVDVYRFMARCLSAVMSDRRIQDDFTAYMTANWHNAAGKFPGKPDSWMLPSPRSYRGALQALGFAEVDLGVGRLRTYAEQRITRDAVEWLLDGHRATARDRPEYENATPQEVVEDLADRSLTRFLNDCGLNERGREHNQILDAISVPEEELRAVCTHVDNEVHNEGRDHFGSKASVSEWVDLIVDEIKARRAGVLKRLEDRIRDACRKWVEEVPDRILGVLGEALAEQGVQVALKLLDKTVAEMEHVKGELHAERQEELALTEYLRSDVSDAIGSTGGRLAADSERVKKAIASAVQTGIVRGYNAERRELGSLLAEDLRSGLIKPLVRALGDAADELRIAVEADESEPGSASIKDWPRHVPPADRRVPDALEPGKSVKSVIDPGTFPELFDDLTVRSTGLEEKVEAYRSVRKKVIAGDPDRRAAGQWIITDAKWAPREWLTVDAPPSPASFTVMIKRDHLLERSRAWLNTDGAWKDFLSQGLREYLSDRLPPAERVPREERFRSALDAAFEAAEPLASIDLDMLPKVHPEFGSGLDYRPNTSPIPVAGLPVEESVREFLVKHFKGAQENYQEKVEQALDQSERETRVAVYTSLGAALHPMVFKSLNKPIAEAWKRADNASILINFWEARRSRLLWMSAPIPRPALQALVRGWFIGRMLNLIEIRGDDAAFATEGGQFGFKAMLPVLGRQPIDFLAALLESLPLAVPVAVDRRQPEKYLRPYTQLIEWGSEPGAADADSFLRPSPVFEEWLEHGTTPGGRTPVIEGADRPARRKAAAELLRKEIDSYRRQAEIDRSRDCTPKNAWLGVAEIVSRALSEIVRCLESDEPGEPTL